MVSFRLPIASLALFAFLPSVVRGGNPWWSCWGPGQGYVSSTSDWLRQLMYDARHFYCSEGYYQQGWSLVYYKYIEHYGASTSQESAKIGALMSGGSINTVDNCWYSGGELIHGCVWFNSRFVNGRWVSDYSQGGKYGWDATWMEGGFWLDSTRPWDPFGSNRWKRDAEKEDLSALDKDFFEKKGNVTVPGYDLGGRIIVVQTDQNNVTKVTGDFTVNENGVRVNHMNQRNHTRIPADFTMKRIGKGGNNLKQK